jgi:excisionase family DNA binding protein
MINSDLKTESKGEWLSLGKAAEMLGVHAMTLRRWSDSGQFPSYRTAGGHRRFTLNDILSFQDQRKNITPDDKTDSWADTALLETRSQVALQEEQRWLQAVDTHHLRSQYRQLGHELMGLVLQYIAAEETNGTFTDEARRIGRQYAKYGVQAGLSLTSIIEATLFFRDILIESALEVPTKAYVEPDANLRILRRVNHILNTIQLTLTKYYENIDSP